MHSVIAVFVFTSLLSQPPARSLAAPTQVAVPHQQLVVPNGQTVPVSFANVRNYSVDRAQVLDVRISPDGKWGLVTGRVPGSATILVVFRDDSRLTYDVTVQ